MLGISAVVLAGDRRGAKAIRHQNKAFLEFKGEPLVIHVLRAVQQSEDISGIVVVGPKRELKETIHASSLERKDEIVIVEQRQNLLENGKAGYVHALGMEYSPSVFNSLRRSEYAEIPALFMSCDIPLITHWELEEFVECADLEQCDYTVGLTQESVMESYYPSGGQPGIRMAYFHLADGRCRHNNLHIVKPLKVHRLIFVEHMYLTRYQKKFTNMFRAMMGFLFAGRWAFRTIRVYLGLQFAQFLYASRGGGRLYERVRATNRMKAVAQCIGGIMDMKMEWVFTTYGGAVLDVDNAKDLEIASQMRDLWMDHQQEIVKRNAK
jgi:GTP:adenosylcobinamide-phosphate guanylyltransferase